jgi:hypothetical protein
VTDFERLNAMQDHVHDGDDVGEGLLLLAVEGFALAEFSIAPTPSANASASARPPWPSLLPYPQVSWTAR